jgi:hypothetical protein
VNVRSALAWLVLVLVWCVPAIAHAESRVVLSVRTEDADTVRTMEQRIGRELELRGFTIAPRVDLDGSGSADELGDLLERARAADAVLGVRVVIDREGAARIDVIDRVTGKHTQRTLPAERASHGRSTIALAVAELVDASLVELRLGATTAVGEVEPPADLPVPMPEPLRVGGQAGAGIGLLWPVRSPMPVAVVTAEAGLRPARRVALLADATLPLHAFRSEPPLARVRTFPFLVGVRGDVDVMPARSALRIDLQAGISALALRIEVDPEPGAHARPGTAWTAAGITGVQLRGFVGRRVLLGAGLRLVVPFEDIRVRFDERVVQRFGPLWGGFAGTVVARW